ncbi:hypothetical protein EGW08_002817 [Elysia chlorotica]|uniref:Uncharacterized protein n=1 Tax=Elysia chlorotica TaxID=188477 RepID=A0A433U6N4_ELYCH|nr:hypothetical protein EGW08_002817 [Elysia chlorotica]
MLDSGLSDHHIQDYENMLDSGLGDHRTQDPGLCLWILAVLDSPGMQLRFIEDVFQNKRLTVLRAVTQSQCVGTRACLPAAYFEPVPKDGYTLDSPVFPGNHCVTWPIARKLLLEAKFERGMKKEERETEGGDRVRDRQENGLTGEAKSPALEPRTYCVGPNVQPQGYRASTYAYGIVLNIFNRSKSQSSLQSSKTNQGQKCSVTILSHHGININASL